LTRIKGLGMVGFWSLTGTELGSPDEVT
jgi:hypothetical protein